jgi:hypothetical protein
MQGKNMYWAQYRYTLVLPFGGPDLEKELQFNKGIPIGKLAMNGNG